MAASSSFGREAQLVSPFSLPQFHAKTLTEVREKKIRKYAACHCCFWVRIAPDGTPGDLHPLRDLAILFLCPWHTGIKKANAAFSLELVIPITWVGYSHHLREWELFCWHKLFWSAHFMESAVS